MQDRPRISKLDSDKNRAFFKKPENLTLEKIDAAVRTLLQPNVICSLSPQEVILKMLEIAGEERESIYGDKQSLQETFDHKNHYKSLVKMLPQLTATLQHLENHYPFKLRTYYRGTLSDTQLNTVHTTLPGFAFPALPSAREAESDTAAEKPIKPRKRRIRNPGIVSKSLAARRLLCESVTRDLAFTANTTTSTSAPQHQSRESHRLALARLTSTIATRDLAATSQPQGTASTGSAPSIVTPSPSMPTMRLFAPNKPTGLLTGTTLPNSTPVVNPTPPAVEDASKATIVESNLKMMSLSQILN